MSYLLSCREYDNLTYVECYEITTSNDQASVKGHLGVKWWVMSDISVKHQAGEWCDQQVITLDCV